ncbi:MAG: hypothetical protein JXA90_03115 [Planctomycetes bacterium]|nr:hypothetical protein [Planctomycetota bacterium]
MEDREEPQAKRTPGRRGVDHFRQKGAWVLVAGALLQGGFLTMSWRLLAIGERQLERERALLVAQHAEMLGAVAELGQRVSALEMRAGELGEAAATVRGMVLGKLKCPDLSCPACPRIPPCPEPSGPIIVTAPASGPPPAPSGEAGKQEAPRQQRREP